VGSSLLLQSVGIGKAGAMDELYREEQTGFEPETDQETFLLEHQAYPGSLPEEVLRGVGEAQEGEAGDTGDGGGAVGESIQLDEELRRLLQEDVQQASRRARRGKRRVMLAEPPMKLPEVAAEAVELDLKRAFPFHPSQWVEAEQRELPPTPQALPEQEMETRRRKLPVIELALVALVLAGGALLWYQLGSQSSGSSAEQGGKGSGAMRVRSNGVGQVSAPADMRAPLRNVVGIEPVSVEPQMPLLQTNTPNPKTPNQPPKTQNSLTLPTPRTPRYTPSSPLPAVTAPTTPLLFTVQVYASRSYTDAAELAEQLRRRGLPHVVITSASIRGETWWRVRFGSYPNRLQAEREALRAGFANAWIVPLQ